MPALIAQAETTRSRWTGAGRSIVGLCDGTAAALTCDRREPRPARPRGEAGAPERRVGPVCEAPPRPARTSRAFEPVAEEQMIAVRADAEQAPLRAVPGQELRSFDEPAAPGVAVRPPCEKRRDRQEELVDQTGREER